MSDQTLAHQPIEQEQWLADSDELPRRPRRRLLTPVPLSLLGVLLIACGFIAGVLVEKGQNNSSSAASATSGLTSRLAGLRSGAGGATGAGAGGSRGLASRFGGAGGGATVGEVAYVKAGTLYVSTAEGNTVKVKTSEASTVTKTVKAGVKQIHPGETVIVTGEKGASGAVLARSISVSSGGGIGGLIGAGLGAGSGGAPNGGGSPGKGGAGQSLFGG